jgi:putative isomerase
MNHYDEMKKKLIKGWNTWNVHSVTSHVLLPEGFAINLGLKEYANGDYLKHALIGRAGVNVEVIHPGAHTYDGSYTEINLKWREIEVVIQSAVKEEELVILVTPLLSQIKQATLVVESGILWNRAGYVVLEDGSLKGVFDGKTISVHTTQAAIIDPNIPTQTPYIAMCLKGEIGISTNKKLDIEEIKLILHEKRIEHVKEKEKHGNLVEVYNSMQSCVAWDTIYDPQGDRVITPVSRLWCVNGYILFCWDTYFAAAMASVDNKAIAYCNAIEITRERTENGFIPNVSRDTGFKSRDRSQPPVGSKVVLDLYRKFGDAWLLDELFEDLFIWNTWFFENRQIRDGFLAWGTNPYEGITGSYWETEGVNNQYGALLESGLDNSPMYDEVPFNKETHCLEQADVGLMGLYIMDCKALAEIAVNLGKTEELGKLKNRAYKISKGLDTLWDEKTGMFLNKRADTGEFSHRLSPTNFYALFSDSIEKEKVDRIIEHFYNNEEFWGEWIMPSIVRNDPAYEDQDYWRGRIWAPMNYLVYLAFKQNNLTQACKDLAEKSKKLILKEWLQCGHVHENYCSNSGEGCNNESSDKFYHWGALLSLIALIEG